MSFPYIARYGVPEIVNTHQGSQFTSYEFAELLKSHGIRISMDGRGRWLDNVFIERLWRSVKHEPSLTYCQAELARRYHQAAAQP